MSTKEQHKKGEGAQKIKEETFRGNNSIEFPAMNGGKNPKGITLRAEPTGDRGIYQEMAVRAFQDGKAIGDVLVGLDAKGDLRVLVTADGDGDSDHALALYPERTAENMVEKI